MRRHLLLAVPCLALAGCMGIEGTEEPAGEDEGLVLEVERFRGERATRLVVRLHNRSDDVVEVGCESGYCWAPRMLAVEARQRDGSWVARDPALGYHPGAARLREVHPEELTIVGYSAVDEPGLYRFVLRVDTPRGPVSVRREFSFVGWPEARLEEALALRERAAGARCGSLDERLFRRTIRHAEPDDVLAIFEDTRETDSRFSALRLMVDRGAFVPELSEEVRDMSSEEVRSFAGLFASRASDVQPPLRRAVAERLVEPLEDMSAPLDLDLLYLLEELKDAWPVHAPDAFVLRLARGPEEGDALASLIEVMAYSPPGSFQTDASAILAALDDRCEGAAEASRLAEACDVARARFSPDYFGLGRMRSTSRCGGVGVVVVGACAEIREAFDDLVEEAGPLDLVVLGGDTVSAE